MINDPEDAHDDRTAEPVLVEISRDLALNRAEFFKEHYLLFAEQLTSYAKWLNSSLLAINGAAIISVLNSYDKINHHAKVAGFFISGLILSLLSGWFLQFVYLKTTEVSGEFWVFWKDAAANGNFDPTTQQKLDSKLNKSFGLKNTPPTLGWLSGIAFVIGVILFVSDLKISK